MMSDDGPGASSSSSSAASFNPGDLIWAKMKGFPHWPAKVLEQGQDTPAGRIAIMFFGTKETAFMKPSDCSDYLSNRFTHEISRKHKGFNDGVHEIRVEAGLEAQSYRDPKFFEAEPETSGTGRIRRASYRLDTLMPHGIGRKRSNSGSRSRASSTQHSTLKMLHKHLKRKRLDSESSNGSKRRQMISGGLAGLDSSGLLDLALEDTHHWNDNDSLFGVNDDARSTRSKRSRGVSKVFEDMLGMDGSPVRRTRVASQNEGRRSRLISGVSDFLFDDLFTMNNVDLQAMAADFLNTVDDLPSDSSEIFPSIMEGGTPERPAPLPRPVEFCTKCGSECKLEGKRWRCSAKFCMEWNGLVDEAGPSSSSREAKVHPSNLDIQVPHTSQPVLEEDDEEEEEEEEETPRPKKEGTVTTNQNLTKEKSSLRKKTKSGLKVKQKSSKKERDSTDAVEVKDKKKVQITSPRQYSLSPPSSPTLKEVENKETVDPSPVKDKKQRPNKYNVIKTPPVSKNGLRHCTFCNGQVRPQMCGGNKHRWRCVDKKCRKWYGWVRSNDEIPVDLGRKGRHSSVLGKIKLKRKDKTRTRKLTEKTDMSISSCGEAALAAAGLDTSSLKSADTGRASPTRNPVMTLAEMRRKKMQAAQSLLKMKGSSPKAVLKKKPLKKREQSEVKEEDDLPRPPPSPLTAREMKYRPCAMEKRARWWMSEKRRGDPSPERELQTELADAAAAFRCISHAFRSAAVTRADEPGTVNGSLDLMMDSLLGCMGPLLSLLAKLPNTKPESDTVQKLWNSSAIHMPIFQ